MDEEEKQRTNQVPTLIYIGKKILKQSLFIFLMDSIGS